MPAEKSLIKERYQEKQRYIPKPDIIAEDQPSNKCAKRKFRIIPLKNASVDKTNSMTVFNGKELRRKVFKLSKHRTNISVNITS